VWWGREGEACPRGRAKMQPGPAGAERGAARRGLLAAAEAQRRESTAGHARPHQTDALVARHHRNTSVRRCALEAYGNHACACGCAVLDARDDLLADEAALVEVDAAKLVHVALMRKRIPVSKVGAALRDAKRDSMSLVLRRVDKLSANVGAGIGGATRRYKSTQARPG